MSTTARTNGQTFVVDNGEPPFDVIGDHVTVYADGRAWLTGTVLDSGPWGIEVQIRRRDGTGTVGQVLAWGVRGRTFLFQARP